MDITTLAIMGAAMLMLPAFIEGAAANSHRSFADCRTADPATDPKDGKGKGALGSQLWRPHAGRCVLFPYADLGRRHTGDLGRCVAADRVGWRSRGYRDGTLIQKLSRKISSRHSGANLDTALRGGARAAAANRLCPLHHSLGKAGAGHAGRTSAAGYGNCRSSRVWTYRLHART